MRWQASSGRQGPWYEWALNRLGIEYFHETFGDRNRVERWFRELKDRTKRVYNNIKTVKSVEGIAAGKALVHNISQDHDGKRCITWLTVLHPPKPIPSANLFPSSSV